MPIESSIVSPIASDWSYYWGTPGENTPPESANWQNLTYPLLPKAPGNPPHLLWLKVHIPALPHAEPFLYLRGIDQSFRVFQNKRIIYTFGEIPNQANAGFDWYPGFAWHLIPLPSNQETILYFQIYSQAPLIGIFGQPRLGSEAEHMRSMLQHEWQQLVVGIILVFLSLFLLILISRTHAISLFFYLGLFAFLSGLFILAWTESKQLFFYAPLFWRWIEKITLFLAPIPFTLFMHHVFYHRQTRWIQKFTWFYLGITGLVLSGMALGTFGLWQFHNYFLGAILIHLGLNFYMVFKNRSLYPHQATIIAWGLLGFSPFLIYDIFNVLGWFSWSYPLSHWGLLLFLLSMVYILRISIQKIQAEKLQAETLSREKDLFLANMSHELRTPLNAIIGFSNLLKGVSELPPKKQNYLTRIHSNSLHLLSLINDILDISKLEAGKKEVSPETFLFETLLNELSKDTSPLIQKQNNQFEIQNHCPQLETHQDKRYIKQILINLISNAAKFTENGQIILKVETHNGAFLCHVEDNGIGIKESFIPQLFELFTQEENRLSRHFEGTGLGLRLSKKLAQLMGGDLTVKSKLGEGSCFSLSLPCRYTSQPA